jgi:hypothetical protein
MRNRLLQYFLIAASVFSACLSDFTARADNEEIAPPPRVVVPDLEVPEPELLRPLPVPGEIERDRGARLIERGRIENERMRLERRGDRTDPRVQDRLRRLDRASDRLR